MSQNDALRDALTLVFGTHATKNDYPTAHVLAVMNKLLGRAESPISEAELIAQLRLLPWAHPRPGKGRHLLAWRFGNADGTDTARVGKRKQPPRREKPVAESLKLKR